MKNLILFVFTLLFISCQTTPDEAIKIEGELKQWHKVTLELNGPETMEWAKENPFLDYRLEATFTNGNKTYTVPGFLPPTAMLPKPPQNREKCGKCVSAPTKPGNGITKFPSKKEKTLW